MRMRVSGMSAPKSPLVLNRASKGRRESRALPDPVFRAVMALPQPLRRWAYSALSLCW